MKALQDAEFIASQGALEFGEMPVLGTKDLHGAVHGGELGVELVEPEGGEGRGTAQLQDDRHGRTSVKGDYTRPHPFPCGQGRVRASA